jgi:hypothetical protein
MASTTPADEDTIMQTVELEKPGTDLATKKEERDTIARRYVQTELNDAATYDSVGPVYRRRRSMTTAQ